MTELDVATQIAAGVLHSPHPVAGFWMVALRISGSGLAFRKQHDEHVYRDPQLITSAEFLQRCNGLPVVANHPDGTLTGDEYASRSLGAIVLPYVANGDGVMNPEGTEAWGVARIYGDDVVQAMSEGMSTSPAVVFTPADGNERAEMEDGSALLIENTPSFLCHLAICDQGIWDKSGPPAGCRFDSSTTETGAKNMTEEEQAAADKAARKDADGSNIDKVLAGLTGLTEKMDAFGKRMDAMETTEKERADKRRLDADTLIDHGTRSDAHRREEEGSLSDAQLRADAACTAWGRRSAPPMQSEKPMAYRKRLLREHTRHSSIFKDADLDVLAADVKLFAKAEETIYADSVQASRNPKDEGYQIERNVVDPDTGHRIRTWHGGDTIFKHYAPPSRRVQKIFDSRALAGR